MTGGVRRGERLRDCPGFSAFWTAGTVSGFGTYVTTLAIQVLVVVTLHEGAAGVGLVSAARWLPYLLFGLVIGVLVDRSRRRPLLVSTDLVRAGLLVAVPVLALRGQLTIVVLMGFMVVFGLASLVNDAASQSFVPRLVPAQMLTRANARLDQSDAVAQASGPALAGVLVSLLTAPWAVLVDAASYLISGLLLLRIPVVEPPSRRVRRRGVRSEAVEGLRWVYGHRTLKPYAIGTHAWFLALSSGHLAGWTVFGVGELILGLSMGASNANEMGYRQAVTPDHLQARSNATMRSINRAMMVVGAPLGGLLADAIGFRVVLWFSVAGFLMVAAGRCATPYRNARLDEASIPIR